MKYAILSKFAGILLLTSAFATQAAPIDIFESCVNVDGTVYDVSAGCAAGAAPASVFDNIGANSLGSVSIVVLGAGAHHVSLYVDAEIDEAINTFFNETGATGGAPPGAAQSWEIDEPGFVFGDIFTNFNNSALDNTDGIGAIADDVAMAMAWDFVLAADEQATVVFNLSDVMPGAGFWLRQSDPQSGIDYYMSSFVRVTKIGGGPPGGAPTPGTLVLLAAGLLLLAWKNRQQQFRN
jgi:hypothetical protein